MVTKNSPLVAAGLREQVTSFGAPRDRLIIYTLRALDFFRHPYFLSDRVIGDVIARDLLFDSLAFRLRPIAMTDRDDSSIWSTLRSMEQIGGLDPDALESYESRYRTWLAITDEKLREWWPNWQIEEPRVVKIQEQHADAIPIGTPIEELWDRVFGDGPHSDFERVLRNKVPDSLPDGREFKHAVYGKLLATISAVRPVIEDLYGDVVRAITGPGDSEAQPFTLARS